MRLFSTAAGRGVLILIGALVLAAFLDAEGLRKQAETQPQGLGRTLAIDVTRPLARISRALRLTVPRHELQVAIGRGSEDEINTKVTLPPPATVSPPRHTATTTTTTTTRPAARGHGRKPATRRPTVTSTDPLRIWVAGDSLAEVPGEGIERLSSPDLDVIGIESRLSTGLARPDLYNWFTRFQQVIATIHPQVAILSFGADDAHGLMTGVPAGQTVGPFGSPSWIAEYRRRVDGVTRELNAAGIRTIWLGLPFPDGPGFRQSFPVMNRILASVARAHAPDSYYVDTWHMFEGAHGRYSAYLRVHGKLTLLRLPDGVHYTAAGGDLIARAVLAELRRVYDLR